MRTEINRMPDSETGVNFFHTAHVDEAGTATTDTTSVMLDQAANAAACRIEAGWLKAVIDHRLDKHDPEVADVLMRATEMGAGIEPLPPYLRIVDPHHVYTHIRNLEARAEGLERWADFNLDRLSSKHF